MGAGADRAGRKPGPLSGADISKWARLCLRSWSDDLVWLETPLPRLIRPDDELEGAQLLRGLVRDSLEEALSRSDEDTETLRARRVYLVARLAGTPLARAAREMGITRRRLVLAQGKEDRIVMTIFMRRFNAARNNMAGQEAGSPRSVQS